MTDKNETWTRLWRASGVTNAANAIATPHKDVQTLVIDASDARAMMRRAGFDRADYDVVTPIDMRRLVYEETEDSAEQRDPLYSSSACFERSEWLHSLLNTRSLLTLRKGRETPYDVDSLDALSEFMTHIAVWRHVVRHRLRYALVISGDKFDSPHENVPARIERLLREAPTAFDVLYLSYRHAFGNGGTQFVVQRVPGSAHLARYGAAGCMLVETSAYVVTFDGARRLLARALPVETRLAPYMFMAAKTDCEHVALLAQPPLAKYAMFDSEQLLTFDDLTIMVPRRYFVAAIGGLALISVLLAVTTIIFYIKWRRGAPVGEKGQKGGGGGGGAKRRLPRKQRYAASKRVYDHRAARGRGRVTNKHPVGLPKLRA